ncbi:protein gar2-like isoform X2 [Musa acuminata AAA Group]|uniref:protein gar2-like isoform X2 n=1 Tax=Musa acuminata AAA Group TaxID=214697 RepID=UPI0031E46C4F
MPPRSARKSAARKMPSRAKKPSPQSATTLPPAVEESPSEVAAVKEEPAEEEVLAAPHAVEAPEEGNTLALESRGEVLVEVKTEEAEVEAMAMRETESEEKVEGAVIVEKIGEAITTQEVSIGDAIAMREVEDEAMAMQEMKSEEKAEGAAIVEKIGEEFAAEVNGGGETASEKGGDSTVLPSESVEAPKDADDSANETDVDEGTEQEVKNEAEVSDGNDDEGVEESNDGDGNRTDDNADNEENDEDAAALYMQAQMEVRKKHKKFGVFVGGLDKSAVEKDLIEVFGVFGEIKSVRIVRNPVTQKSKGYAFIHYANIDHAKKALTELKDGTEVRGKQVGISASQDNDTLYLGNICKTWTKEQVIETLKGYGIEQLEDIILPDDPKNEGKTKGFAFLEFNSHSDAMAAFQRLRKPDALFGRDRSAKVSFAENSMHPSEEVTLQVKTVYIESIPDFWDGKKIKEICQHYGEVEKVQLFKKSTTKKKNFAFVEFTSRESAVACMEGVNSAQNGEGEVKIKVNLARPPSKGRLAKRGARGGFKINKDGEVTKQVAQSKKKKRAKSKEVFVQGNAKSKLKKDESSNRGIVINERLSKKARRDYYYGNSRGRPSTVFDHQMDAYSENPRDSYVLQTVSHTPRYALPATNYQGYAYAGASGSKIHHPDLEPHAGYLPASQHRQYPYGYEQRVAPYDVQPNRGSEFTGGLSATQTSFPVYSSSTGYQGGYAYPSIGAYPGRVNHAPRGYY